MTPTQQKASELGIKLYRIVTDPLDTRYASAKSVVKDITTFLTRVGVADADIDTEGFEEYGDIRTRTTITASLPKTDDELEVEINAEALQFTRDKDHRWAEYQRLKAEFDGR